MGCADVAAVDGRRGSNVHEVHPWLWQFGHGKPPVGGITVVDTADRVVVKDDTTKQSAAETRQRRRADRAGSCSYHFAPAYMVSPFLIPNTQLT